MKIVLQSQFGNLVLQNILNSAIEKGRSVNKLLTQIESAIMELSDTKSVIKVKWLAMIERWK